MLIVLSGTDGAGKSTQIRLLCSFLAQKGYCTKSLWARGGYTPIFQLLKNFIRAFSLGKFPRTGKSEIRSKAFSISWIAILWLNLSILDLLLFWGLYVRILILFGRVVICDRYIDDTRLDFRRNFPGFDFEKSWLWVAMEYIIPNPDAAFLLYVPVEVTLKRSKDKFEPYPDDEATLSWRLNAYRDFSLFPPSLFVHLDGQLSISEVSRIIISIVAEKIDIT